MSITSVTTPRFLTGLFAEFYALPTTVTKLADVNFAAAPTSTGLVGTLDTVNGTSSFWSGGPQDRFAARYTGDLNVTKAGAYTLYLTSDDGSALYVDGKLVINNDGLHASALKTTTLNLSAGAHKIEIRYFENTGYQTLKLEWKGADTGGVRKVVSGPALTTPNHAPDAVNDAVTTAAGQSVLVNVLANDRDVDGHKLNLLQVGPAANGSVAIENGQVRYTPKAGFTGQDKFTYKVSDGKGGQDTATVTVSVAANRAPDAVNDTVTTATGQSVLVNVLANDTDPNGDRLVLTQAGQAANGTVAIENGQIRYTPKAGFNGQDQFTYKVSDGKGGQDTATVTVSVTAPNRAPDAVNDTVTTAAGQSVLVNVLANDTDPNGDRLVLTQAGQAANGTVAIENGQIRYTPKAGFSGQDQFTYTVSDGKGGQDTATATVSVTAPPVVVPPVTTPEAGKQGLEVSYFRLPGSVDSLSDIDFTAPPAATGTATSLNHMNMVASFWSDGPQDKFAARYTGDLNVTKPGTYTFYLTSDDGSVLYIDGQKVIDHDGLHATTEKSVTLTLAAGKHDIELRYFENTGYQSLKLEWKGPDSAGVRSVITGPSLSHPEADDPVRHAGLLAEYFVLPNGVSSLADVDFGAAPAKTVQATEINHLATTEAFWTGGPTDRFAARYEGDLNVVNGGTYTLYLTSDDGSVLYVDGKKVIDNDGLHSTREIKVTLELSAGAHDIELRYFENTGTQTLKFEWQGPDSDGVRKVVSGTSLSHDGAIHAGDPGPCPDMGGAVCQCGSAEHPAGEHTDGDHTDHTDGGTTGTPTPGEGDGAGDHNHDAEGPLPLPNTAAEADAFVAAVKALPEGHAHPDDPKMALEHQRLLELVPRAEATHVAIANGDWFDPDTWYEGRIPGEGAKVLIPEGVSVRYDGESDASLFTLRIDGELSFATDADTRMVVDTMVVSGSGRLEIGTAETPVEAGVKTDILIANNGDIDVTWDPMLLSRGILSHGQVEIHGAEKTAFLKVADAPMAGDRVIELAEVPEGWRVGDTIIVSGTHKTGWTWTGAKEEHVESQDEEVTITAIEGGRITIDRPLVYDHDTPRADLFAYVANTTRNITIASEDGEATPVHQRGHVMLMHNDDIDVRYAAFDDLGRTDKSKDAFDIATLTTVEADSNIKGRYSLHLHKTGTADQDDPAIVVGNTVSGSPGWGFVQHSSNANFIDNVSFDVFGAGFAAEDGDETGIWLRNMAIKSEGIGWGDWSVKAGGDVARHDNGRTGDGFFFAGRLVEAAENVAVNTTHGFVWMHRSAPSEPSTDNLDHPEMAYGSDNVSVNTAPIQGFRDNEAFGTQIGLIVVKSGPAQNHDVRTILDGFLNWETSEGRERYLYRALHAEGL